MVTAKRVFCFAFGFACSFCIAQTQPRVSSAPKPAPTLPAAVTTPASTTLTGPPSGAKVLVRFDDRTFNNRVELSFYFDKPANTAAFVTLQVAEDSRVTPDIDKNRFLYGRLIDSQASVRVRPQNLLIGIPADHAPQEIASPIVIKIEEILRLSTVDGKGVFELFLQFGVPASNNRLLGQAAPTVAPASVRAVQFDKPKWLDRHDLVEGRRLSEDLGTITFTPNEAGALKVRLFPAQRGGVLYLLNRLLPFAAIGFIVVVSAAIIIHITNFGSRFRYVLFGLWGVLIIWLATALWASPIEYVADNYSPVIAVAIGLFIAAGFYHQLPKVVEFLRKSE